MLVVRGMVDLDVAPGEVVALVGEGGSDLLRALACLDPLCTGTAQVDGFDVATETEAARSRVGLVDREAANRDVVAHAMSHGLTREVAERRAVYLLQSLGVRGPDWRLALAFALIHEPRVLLVNDPPAEAWPLLARISEESQLAVLVAVTEPSHAASARQASLPQRDYPRTVLESPARSST